MGLDMYLYLRKEEYESASQWRNSDLTLYPTELEQFEKDIRERNFASRTVKKDYQIGYWRKANAIHKWFVENCGNGEDTCQIMYVSLEQLKELRELVQTVLNQHTLGEKILPTQSGFFFGTTEYDEWYFKDLEYTKQLLDKVIEFVNSDNGKDYEVIYQASW